MDFEPRDIVNPPCVLGSDLIDYMIMVAGLSDESDASQWKQSAEVIDPMQPYTTSLEAAPDWSVTRWIPPIGSGQATVIILPRPRGQRS